MEQESAYIRSSCLIRWSMHSFLSVIFLSKVWIFISIDNSPFIFSYNYRSYLSYPSLINENSSYFLLHSRHTVEPTKDMLSYFCANCCLLLSYTTHSGLTPNCSERPSYTQTLSTCFVYLSDCNCCN